MQLVIVLSLASLLISTSFASTPFADEAWQESATVRGESEKLNHYMNSKLPMPSVDVFPATFKWGVAIAEFQNSGAETLPNSNWAAFEHKKNFAPSGKSVDHWNQYPQDIELMKSLNINSFRFSIDWSSIQPLPGVWNEDALKRYDALCVALQQSGITPMATLHHFTHPVWFDALGGFEKEENIKYFVDFAETVFRRYHSNISLWCTINEPAIYAMCGYVLGIHSPGKGGRFSVAGTVLKNLLKAHVAVYQRLQSVISELGLASEKHEIGIVHNILKFTSRYSFDPIGQLTTSLFTSIANDPVMGALANDKFSYDPFRNINATATMLGIGALALSFVKQKKADQKVSDWAKKHWCIVGGSALTIVASNIARMSNMVSATITGLSKSFDFIGLNYYASPVVGWNRQNTFGPTCFSDQVMGDLALPVSDPTNFKAAIEAVAKFGKPIYLTETGCADDKDDRRPLLMRESLHVIGEALKNGIDIRGYYHWTLMDNYEWDHGFEPKFGLCDRDRNPRLSGLWLRDFVEQVKAQAQG